MTESDPGVGGVQEQLWAYEDADTQREALAARLAASDAKCQQLRVDLEAAQNSALEVHRLSLRFQHSVWNGACAMHNLAASNAVGEVPRQSLRPP